MKALIAKDLLPKIVNKEKPTIKESTDVIVKMVKTTICGSDLHILKNKIPSVIHGITIGHEGIGIVDAVGSSVKNFKKDDLVIISCISYCGTCDSCKKQLYSHCENAGWVLGNTENGTQAEYVRIPFADNGLYLIPPKSELNDMVMLSDILPTGFEVGVLNGKVKPGDTVAIVGAGPVGLAALLTSRLYSPSNIVVIDLDDNRLKQAMKLGASHALLSTNVNDLLNELNEVNNNEKFDVVIEAVGVPATFNICQKLVKSGGNIAVVGVHSQPSNLELETLWGMNINISTGFVNTSSTGMLLKMVANKNIDISGIITHEFNFDDIEEAYQVFSNAKDSKAIKVIINFN